MLTFLDVGYVLLVGISKYNIATKTQRRGGGNVDFPRNSEFGIVSNPVLDVRNVRLRTLPRLVTLTSVTFYVLT
jgi:hypothetical protein